jgi:hypothetical protein
MIRLKLWPSFANPILVDLGYWNGDMLAEPTECVDCRPESLRGRVCMVRCPGCEYARGRLWLPNIPVQMMPHFIGVEMLADTGPAFRSRWMIYLGRCELCNQVLFDTYSLSRDEA